jgi:hypothetical protein
MHKPTEYFLLRVNGVALLGPKDQSMLDWVTYIIDRGDVPTSWEELPC